MQPFMSNPLMMDPMAQIPQGQMPMMTPMSPFAMPPQPPMMGQPPMPGQLPGQMPMMTPQTPFPGAVAPPPVQAPQLGPPSPFQSQIDPVQYAAETDAMVKRQKILALSQGMMGAGSQLLGNIGMPAQGMGGALAAFGQQAGTINPEQVRGDRQRNMMELQALESRANYQNAYADKLSQPPGKTAGVINAEAAQRKTAELEQLSMSLLELGLVDGGKARALHGFAADPVQYFSMLETVPGFGDPNERLEIHGDKIFDKWAIAQTGKIVVYTVPEGMDPDKALLAATNFTATARSMLPSVEDRILAEAQGIKLPTYEDLVGQQLSELNVGELTGMLAAGSEGGVIEIPLAPLVGSGFGGGGASPGSPGGPAAVGGAPAFTQQPGNYPPLPPGALAVNPNDDRFNNPATAEAAFDEHISQLRKVYGDEQVARALVEEPERSQPTRRASTPPPAAAPTPDIITQTADENRFNKAMAASSASIDDVLPPGGPEVPYQEPFNAATMNTPDLAYDWFIGSNPEATQHEVAKFMYGLGYDSDVATEMSRRRIAERVKLGISSGFEWLTNSDRIDVERDRDPFLDTYE